MATGSIVRLERGRGFGFIAPEGGKGDVFFHTTALQGVAFDDLREGQAVEFDVEPDPRNPSRSRAINVRVNN
jgi:CspA family cold shock protein